MSDQPPSGPADPWPPAASSDARPADPTSAPPPPATDPLRAPGPSTWPAAAPPGQPTTPVPGVPGQPAAVDPAAAGNAGFAAPGQPAEPGQAGWAHPTAPPPQGWIWPASGGLVPADPYGYGHPYGWYPAGAGWDPNDPLVTPPHAGFGEWFSRCTGAVRRGWRLLLPIMLLTQVVPGAVLSALSLALGPSSQVGTAPDGAPVLPDGYFPHVAALLGVAFVGSLLIGLVQSLGWAAGTWVVARQAAGEPVALGPALRYGLRRALGLWGWTLLVSVLMGVGLCFCVLPGIYLAFALSLTGPVYLFERENPIGRSFRIFHQRLGPVLGRVALVAAVVILGSMVGGVLEQVGLLPFGDRPLAEPGAGVGALAVVVLAAALVAPVYLVQLVGLLATYAEHRAHEGPVNSARLAAELG